MSTHPSQTGRLQIEEPRHMFAPMATVSLAPKALDVNVKIILTGATDEYYLLQKADPEFARRFRVKVDFAERFVASAQTCADGERLLSLQGVKPGQINGLTQIDLGD